MIGFSENFYFPEVEQFSLSKIILCQHTSFLRNTSPNSRVCALETTASFLALPVPCIPGPRGGVRTIPACNAVRRDFFTYYRFLALRRHCSVAFRCVYTSRFQEIQKRFIEKKL